MSYQSAVFLGYQQIVGLASATAPTLPVGPQAASGSACNLSGNLLTVGGTVTGAFAVGQVVQGTGIPANTYITSPASELSSPASWYLSQSCTTESGEAVIAYADAGANLAFIAPESQPVRYLPGGGVGLSATVGMPIQVGQQAEYAAGDLAALRFIQQTATATLNLLYYRVPTLG